MSAEAETIRAACPGCEVCELATELAEERMRVVELEGALAECLRYAPGGIDDAPDRQGPAVEAWIAAWALIEGTKADWRSRR